MLCTFLCLRRHKTKCLLTLKKKSFYKYSFRKLEISVEKARVIAAHKWDETTNISRELTVRNPREELLRRYNMYVSELYEPVYHKYCSLWLGKYKVSARRYYVILREKDQSTAEQSQRSSCSTSPLVSNNNKYLLTSIWELCNS